MSTDSPNLENEVRVLELHKKRDDLEEAQSLRRARLALEVAKLDAEVGKLNEARVAAALPFWKDGKVVGIVTGIVAAVIPVTTAVSGWFQAKRELGLQDQKQAHEMNLARERQTEQIRTSYLDRVKDETERRRTLRFLEATTDDAKLRTWAGAEMVIVDEDLAKLNAQIAEQKTRADEAEKKAAEAERQRLEGLTKGKNEDSRQAVASEQARREAVEQKKKLEDLQIRVRAKPLPPESLIPQVQSPSAMLLAPATRSACTSRCLQRCEEERVDPRASSKSIGHFCSGDGAATCLDDCR